MRKCHLVGKLFLCWLPSPRWDNISLWVSLKREKQLATEAKMEKEKKNPLISWLCCELSLEMIYSTSNWSKTYIPGRYIQSAVAFSGSQRKRWCYRWHIQKSERKERRNKSPGSLTQKIRIAHTPATREWVRSSTGAYQHSPNNSSEFTEHRFTSAHKARGNVSSQILHSNRDIIVSDSLM